MLFEPSDLAQGFGLPNYGMKCPIDELGADDVANGGELEEDAFEKFVGGKDARWGGRHVGEKQKVYKTQKRIKTFISMTLCDEN